MKKLIVLLMAAVFVFGTITAYANPSVGSLREDVVIGRRISVNTEGLKPEEISKVDDLVASGIIFKIVNPDVLRRYKDRYKLLNGELIAKRDVATVVDTVNDADADIMSTTEAAKRLKNRIDNEPVEYIVYDDFVPHQEDLKLNEYSFMTGFSDIMLEQDGEDSYDLAGREVAATITIKLDALQGETDAQKLAENLLVMLINPLTGETVFVNFDADDFDLEKNPPEVKVDFPFLGTFAFITK